MLTKQLMLESLKDTTLDGDNSAITKGSMSETCLKQHWQQPTTQSLRFFHQIWSHVSHCWKCEKRYYWLFRLSKTGRLFQQPGTLFPSSKLKLSAWKVKNKDLEDKILHLEARSRHSAFEACQSSGGRRGWRCKCNKQDLGYEGIVLKPNKHSRRQKHWKSK